MNVEKFINQHIYMKAKMFKANLHDVKTSCNQFAILFIFMYCDHILQGSCLACHSLISI